MLTVRRPMDRLWQRLGIKYPRAQVESLPSVQPTVNYEVQTIDLAEPNLIGAGNERGTKSISYYGAGPLTGGVELVNSKLTPGVYGLGPSYFGHTDDFVNLLLFDVLDGTTSKLYYRWRLLCNPVATMGMIGELVCIVPTESALSLKIVNNVASGKYVSAGCHIRRIADLLASDVVGLAGGTFESTEMT